MHIDSSHSPLAFVTTRISRPTLYRHLPTLHKRRPVLTKRSPSHDYSNENLPISIIAPHSAMHFYELCECLAPHI